MQRIVIGAVALVIVVAALVTAYISTREQPDVPAIKLGPDGKPDPRFMSMHEQFVKRTTQGNIDVLFLGDSLIEDWATTGADAWKEHYETRHAANFGISGDGTQHLLWRVSHGELTGIEPRVVVLMVGTNNVISLLSSPERIAHGIELIVRACREQTGAKVLLVGILPRGDSPASSGRVRAKIRDVNLLLSMLDDGKKIRYLDASDQFLESDGSIATDTMSDFLHLTPHGYQLWAERMENLLIEMMR